MSKYLLSIIYLLVLSFVFLVHPANDAYAADFGCSLLLTSPQTTDASDSITINTVVDSFDGDTSWEFNWSIYGPFGYVDGGSFGTGVISHNLGNLQFNGQHTLMLSATNSSNDQVVCSGSPITITVNNGAPPPTAAPTPAPASDDPLCTIAFAHDSSISSVKIKTDESIGIVILGDGNPTYGSFWEITRVGVGVLGTGSHPGKSENFTPTDPTHGNLVFAGYHAPSVHTASKHLCSGGGRTSLTVIIGDESDLGGSGSGDVKLGENPCPNGNCDTALGSLSSDPTELIGKILGYALGLGGGIALIFMVIGSIRILMSSGDQQKLNAGREQIIAAVAGLLFIVFSILMIQFIDIKLVGLAFG